MKKIILIATTMLGLNAFAYSADAVKDAEALLKLTQDRFGAGEVTMTDVKQAEAFVLEMKIKAGVISKVEYCNVVIPVLENAVQGISAEEKVGLRTIEDVIHARIELYRVKSECPAN
ncbi:MAG: hypothetical protein AB7F86_12785 [Bdellovibrionales bacterium]